VQIGDILVSEDVLTEYFACDYESCRGACCIEGDAGAPVAEDELGRLEKDYPAYSSLMTPRGRNAVTEKGFFEMDVDGELVTPLPDGGKECAYCHFGPSGECLCAIEKSGCVKPRSCSLYPVRVTELTGGGLALNLHRWDICTKAFEKGRREGTLVYQFLKKPLSDCFGKDFYEALEVAAGKIREED